MVKAMATDFNRQHQETGSKEENDNSKPEEKGLLNGTGPKKVGILSTGGPSGPVVERLRTDYHKMLSASSYELFYGDIDQILSVDHRARVKAGVGKPAGKAEDHLQGTGEVEKDREVDNEVDKKSNQEHDRTSAQDDYELVFEPDEEFIEGSGMPDDDDLGDETGGDIDHDEDFEMTDAAGAVRVADLDEGAVTTKDQTEPPVTAEAKETGRPLSLRERAAQIFMELKRRLGFVKKRETGLESAEDDKIKVKESEVYEESAIEPEEPDQTVDDDSEMPVHTHMLDPGSDQLGQQTRQTQLAKPDHDHKPGHSPVHAHAAQPEYKPVPPGQGTKPRVGIDSARQPKPDTVTRVQEARATEPVHHKVSKQILRKKTINILKDNEILFIITYLDDEHNIENTLVILNLAKELGLFTIVIASLPRYFGKVDNVHSMNKTLQKMRLQSEMVLLLPYFGTIDFKLIPDLINELLELITEPGLINLDIADLKVIIKGGNVGVISFGTGRRVTRVKDAFYSALDSKLMNVELAGVQKALLNVTGGHDMTLAEVEAIAEQIKNRIKPGARLILGARINPELSDSIKIFLLLGVTPMQVMVNRYANE